VAEAAEHFNVSPAQLRKDLGVLFVVGLPGGMPDDLIDVDLEAFEDDGVIRVSNADYLARPVRFAPAEAVALTVALGALLETADDVAAEVVERTLDKLRTAAGGEDAPRLHVDAADLVSRPAEQRLREAIRTQRQVRLRYHAASHDDVSVRVVDPRAVAHVNGLAYLDAYCHTAQADRAFRVDRVLDAEVLPTAVADPQALPKDLTREWFTGGRTTPVTLRLAPEGSWLPEYVPVREQTLLPDGGLEVELDAASHIWILRLLGRLTPDVQVLSPASLADEHRHRLAQALALYASDVGPDTVD
jgi:proteasome accessory factor C